MSLITIREMPNAAPGAPNAVVSFDHGPEYPIAIHDPSSERDEARLSWYFEEHLRFPFTKKVLSQEAKVLELIHR